MILLRRRFREMIGLIGWFTQGGARFPFATTALALGYYQVTPYGVGH